MKLISSLIVLAGVISVNGDCNCGWSNSGRIVGGKESSKNAYPFAVALVKENGFQFCGGTIVTLNHVLTAAHCVINKIPRMIRVRAGVHDLRSREGSTYEVLQIKNHERYNVPYYDIALVVTKGAMKFGQNVGPACLPSARLSLTGQNLRTVGWGHTQENGKSSSVLRETNLKVVPFKECFDAWREDEVHPIEAIHTCTFWAGKDTCQGDSGGPLVWLNPATRRYTLAAVVSFGSGCGGTVPGVNTDVSAFLPWIHNNIAATARGVSACVKG